MSIAGASEGVTCPSSHRPVLTIRATMSLELTAHTNFTGSPILFATRPAAQGREEGRLSITLLLVLLLYCNLFKGGRLSITLLLHLHYKDKGGTEHYVTVTLILQSV